MSVAFIRRLPRPHCGVGRLRKVVVVTAVLHPDRQDKLLLCARSEEQQRMPRKLDERSDIL